MLKPIIMYEQLVSLKSRMLFSVLSLRTCQANTEKCKILVNVKAKYFASITLHMGTQENRDPRRVSSDQNYRAYIPKEKVTISIVIIFHITTTG